MERKFKILIVSSYPPDRSAGLAQDYINMFEREGHDVDFLTLYGYPCQKSNHYSLYPEHLSTKVKRWKEKFHALKILRPIKDLFIHSPKDSNCTISLGGKYIPNFYEDRPLVDPEKLIGAITKVHHYDFIYVLFMQRMMTSKTLLALYQRFGCPILLNAVDMAPITGGCFYFGDCRGFEHECDDCPMLQTTVGKEQIQKNFQYKKHIYESIQISLLCNSYQKKFVEKSKIFEKSFVQTRSILLDETRFVERNNKDSIREKKNIPPNKKYIVLSRYSGARFTRAKGYDHLVNIINLFCDGIGEEIKNRTLLLLVGEKDDDFVSKLNIDVLNLDKVQPNELIDLYSISTMFISTSVDDAGPSMVNQSMMCGTPVVAFSIGTALDVLYDGLSGYRIPNFDDKQFSEAIGRIIKMCPTDYQTLRATSRKVALEKNTSSAIIKKIIEAYDHARKQKPIRR